MLLRISKINRRHVAMIISALIVISSILGAVVTAPIYVFALSAGGIHTTIASIILSLLLQCGVAPTNASYLSALNSSYGYTIESAISEGLLTETASGLVDSGLSSAIEGASAYTELGLGDIFSTTAADVGVELASGGVNIANTAIHVGKAGTIGAFAGAVAVGVGVGVLINHVRQGIGNLIKYGFPMGPEQIQTIANNIPEGYGNCWWYVRQYSQTQQYSGYTFTQPNVVCFGYYNDAKTYINSENVKINGESNNLGSMVYQGYSNKTAYDPVNYPGGTGSSGSLPIKDTPRYNYLRVFENRTELNNYIASLKNGTESVDYNPVAPDIIGPEGNQSFDRTEEDYPGISNQIPEGADMTPVDMADYQDFANNANNNTSAGNTGQEIQGEGFDDLVSPLIVDAPTIPDEPIIPDQPVDVPTVPERPIVPNQPTIPDKPGITQEELDQALQGATTIDLRSIFPFCIPFDLYNLLLIFDTGENRKAPHIKFTFPITGWEIDVDLVVFDPVAGLLRLLELILFIVGLAVATRRLIGAGGE